jgi:beta-barrel assembly-enhancing protease
MKKSLIVDIAKIVLVFGIIWALFTFLPIFKNDSKIEIPVEKEEKVGEIILKDILKNPSFKKVEDKKLDSVLLIVRRRLTDHLDQSRYHYRIVVFDNQMINAFALPGGYLMVSTGLLNLVEKPEELAAVLAHEMGHIEKKHMMRRLIRMAGINIILSGDRYAIGEISKTLTSNVFDRRQEKEADEFSLDLLEKSGINPKVLASFFLRVTKKEGETNENLEFLLDHPNSDARIKASLEYKISPDFKEKKIDVDWNIVKSELQPKK